MRTTYAHEVALAAVAFVACSDTAAARPQLLVVVDTDAHLVGELANRDDVSPDAAIDTLRIDALDSSGTVYDSRLFVVGDAGSWPVSFGVLPPANAGAITLRIRAFRGLFAQAGTINGASTLDPPSQVAIERLASFDAPSGGVKRFAVLLAEDCMGTASSFLGSPTTCVDESNTAADPHSGYEALTGSVLPASRNGTWSDALEVANVSSTTSKVIAIPGGFSILGDRLAVGFGAGAVAPLPLRPVVVSPFLLDKFEVTVGVFRSMVQGGSYTGDMPVAAAPSDPSAAYCTWLGATNSNNDTLPLNCVSYALARGVCQALHGDLPSESQWEHAARGRGQRRLYPWGNSDPTCCALSAGRSGGAAGQGQCDGTGIEPVGSHLPTAACNDIGDVTRDGVVDMDGSLTEALLDDSAPYDAPCWTTSGILHDPVCRVGANSIAASRGVYWNGAPEEAVLAGRSTFGPHDMAGGFRCAYPDGSQ